MLLSIIIPVYNAGIRVRECLNSISKLLEEDFEVIVINDGSTDETQSFLEEYKDQRFVFLKKDNSGVSDTRNLGLSLAKGKYVTFVDADDAVTERYNALIDILKKTNYDLYTFNYVRNFNGKEEVVEKEYLRNGVNDKKALIREFFAGHLNSVWTNIYKTEVIRREKISFDKDMKMGEDLLFNAKYFQVVDEVYFTNLPGYIYALDNVGSAMHNRRLCYLDDYMKIYDELVYMRSEYAGNEIDKGNYLLQVYDVLKCHGRVIPKEQEKKLRSSRLFKEIMAETFSGQWKLIVKKFLVKYYVYKIWIP